MPRHITVSELRKDICSQMGFYRPLHYAMELRNPATNVRSVTHWTVFKQLNIVRLLFFDDK